MKNLLTAVIPNRSAELHSHSQLLNQLSGQSPDGLSLSSSSLANLGRRSTDRVECPKCGKRSIVTRDQNTFDCLNCNFHRELPPVAKQLASRRSYHQLGRTGNLISSRGLLSSDEHLSSLDLADVEPKAESGQPLLFAAIAVIFGILLL